MLCAKLKIWITYFLQVVVLVSSASVTEVLSNMELVTSDLTKRLNEAHTDLSRDAQTTISKSTSNTKELVSQFENQYKDSTESLSDCVSDQQDKLRDITQQGISGVVGCVTGKVREAEGIVAGISGDIQNAQTSVTNAASTIRECGSSQALCAGSETVVLAADAAQTAIDLSSKVSEAIGFVMGIEVGLGVCAAEQAAQVAKNLGELAVEIARCSGG